MQCTFKVNIRNVTSKCTFKMYISNVCFNRTIVIYICTFTMYKWKKQKHV